MFDLSFGLVTTFKHLQPGSYCCKVIDHSLLILLAPCSFLAMSFTAFVRSVGVGVRLGLIQPRKTRL